MSSTYAKILTKYLPTLDYDDANDDLLDAIERIKISPTEPSSKDYGQYLREQQKYLTSRQSNRPPFSVVKRRPTFQTLNSDVSFLRNSSK